MNPSTPEAARPLEVRTGRASSVIVHRIPANFEERFVEWQRGITQAAAASPGYQATDIYPAAGAAQPDWVVVIHFESSQALECWLDSPARAEWTAKLPAEIKDFRLKTLSAGFGPWYAGLVDDGGLPPSWKTVVSVLFGLYPIAMLLVIFLGPLTLNLGPAVAMLISNAASVCILQWIGTPITRRLLGPWLRANGKEARRVSLVGLLLILLSLGVMTFLFRLFLG